MPKNRLRYWREERGLSRRRLAELVDCDPSYIAKLERGERRLKHDWMERLAKGLAVAPTDLISNVQQPDDEIVMAPIIGWSQAGRPVEAVEQAADGHIPVPYGRHSVAAVRVVGTSMSRVAPEGAMIVYDYQDHALIDRKLYLFRIDGEVTFKRFRCSDGPNRLEPDSFEPGHRTIYPTGPIDVIGRVVFIAQSV
jgi:SOS-response transcriptional repressor LexA